MKKRFFGIFLLFVYISGAGFSQATPGEKVTEDVTISPEKPLSFPQQEKIANLAVSALKRIAKARGFIHDKNMGNARRELAESQLASAHPLMILWVVWVSNSEMSNFLQDQEKQGLARRRTIVRRTRKPAV